MKCLYQVDKINMQVLQSLRIYHKFSLMLGCFEHDQSYEGNLPNETKPRYTESEGECQKICQKDKKCKGFSYDSDRKHCVLLTFNNMQRKHKASYISGPKYCSGR